MKRAYQGESRSSRRRVPERERTERSEGARLLDRGGTDNPPKASEQNSPTFIAKDFWYFWSQKYKEIFDKILLKVYLTNESMRVIFLVFSILFAFTLLPAPTFAATDCTVVYGGGQVDCANITPVVTSPTPLISPISPTPQIFPTTPTQSKGGLPIQPKTDVKTTPATGPEALSLLGFIPMAAAGFYLRNKTK